MRTATQLGTATNRSPPGSTPSKSIRGHYLADVITASWGGPMHSTGGDMTQDLIARYDRLVQIAALEGVTVDRNGDTPGPQWQPLGWVFGGWGGAAADFAQPWYQVGRVPAVLSGTLLTGTPAATPRRTVPDVALDADPFAGMLVGQTMQSTDSSGKSVIAYKESPVGVTSLASPLPAALEADEIQSAGGADLGLVNPTLYAHAGTSLLTDVTGITTTDYAGHTGQRGQIYPSNSGKPAVLASLGDDGPLLTAVGYDTATGLGSPSEDFAQRLGAR